MPIKIHGKDYYTVIERVNMFRDKHPENSAITTEIISADVPNVIMKATILLNGEIVATGHAEEVRGSTMINKTSALENCETSAIGRALAAYGLGGTEFASANEVENAISQQQSTQISPDPINETKVLGCYTMFMEVMKEDVDEHDFTRMQEGYKRLSSDERIAVFEKIGTEKIEGTRKGYKSLAKDLLSMTEADLQNSEDYDNSHDIGSIEDIH